MEQRVDVFCHILPKRYEETRWQRAKKTYFPEHVLHASLLESLRKGQRIGQAEHSNQRPAHLSSSSASSSLSSARGGEIQLPHYQVLTDLDVRFRMMDEFENYRQVLTLAGPPIEVVAPEDSETVAKLTNDELAELVQKYPHRFAGAAASLPMNKPDAACRELQRAIRELKLVGVQLYSNVLGKPLDLPEFRPIFQMMAEYNLPILLHPARSKGIPDYSTETSSKYLVWQVLGWPYESSAAMFRIVFSGILEDYPNLKIIVHHTGAMISFFSGRIEAMYTMFLPLIEDERGAPLKKPIMEYFCCFYGDTATFTAASIDCACKFFGADHILFGTDAPFDDEGGRLSIRDCTTAVETSSLSAAEKGKIYCQNFDALFRHNANWPQRLDDSEKEIAF